MFALKKTQTISPSRDLPQEPVRSGEAEKFWFRTDRFFRAADCWYFTTREEKDVGPYGSRTEAEHGLKLFVECVSKQSATLDHAINVARGGYWSVTGFQ